jgi:hypothetical protein
MPKKQLKAIPKFKTDEEAGSFWLEHDSADYIDWSKAKRVSLPKLQASGHVVPVAIPDEEYSRLNDLATERKKSLAETIRQLLVHSMDELTANTAARL